MGQEEAKRMYSEMIEVGMVPLAEFILLTPTEEPTKQDRECAASARALRCSEPT